MNILYGEFEAALKLHIIVIHSSPQFLKGLQECYRLQFGRVLGRNEKELRQAFVFVDLNDNGSGK